MGEKEQEKQRSNPPCHVEKDGTILYGFSNHDIKKIYIAMWIMIIIFIIVIVMAGYVLWKIEAYNIVGKYIAKC